jgi:1,4-dihydroxy-2-naphthoate octaprenyltransferase
MSNQSVFGTIRAPFLLLTPVCIAVGVATALSEQGSINSLYAILALLGGLMAHIGVNTFNEYFDFKSGLDFNTEKTPFSGGSGSLPDNPAAAPVALKIAIASQVVLFAIGVFFVWVHGVAIIPLGIGGMVLVVFYTQWITKHPVLCLIAPGLGIGTLMVMGTHFVLTGNYSFTALLASMVPFFLVNNLLLLNQLPDIEADRAVGRKNIPILYGREVTVKIFNLQLALAYVVMILSVVHGDLPIWTLISLLTVFLAIPAMRGVSRNNQTNEQLLPSLGMNVAINLLTPLLVAGGLVLPQLL